MNKQFLNKYYLRKEFDTIQVIQKIIIVLTTLRIEIT